MTTATILLIIKGVMTYGPSAFELVGELVALAQKNEAEKNVTEDDVKATLSQYGVEHDVLMKTIAGMK